MFEVEKGTIPADYHTGLTEFLRTLKQGECFECSRMDRQKIYSAAYQAGIKISMRKQDDSIIKVYIK